MCHQSDGWKNVNHRDRSRRCGITGCHLKNCCRWGLVLWRCARNSPSVCQVNREEEACVKSSVEHQMCRHQGYGGSSRCRIADNYKIKRKIRGLESLGMICSLEELGISDSVVPKEFVRYPNLALKMFQDEVFCLDLDDEIIELSITLTVRTLFLCVE